MFFVYLFTVIKLIINYTRRENCDITCVNEVITVELHKLQQIANMISFSRNIFLMTSFWIKKCPWYFHTCDLFTKTH